MTRPDKPRQTNRAQRRARLLLARSHRALEQCQQRAELQNAADTPGNDLSVEARRHAQEMLRLRRSFTHLVDALRDQERERRYLIATMIHDLRLPLTVAGGATRIVRDKEIEAEDQFRWLDCAVRSISTMELLLNQLLQDAHEGEGETLSPYQELDLAVLTREAVHDYATLAKGHLLTFYDGSPEGCTVWGEVQALKRLIQNLLSNAVKYSAAGCEVGITVCTHERHVALLVEDEGCGITSLEIEHLFSPFVRGQKARHMAEGYGLGLASVKAIADAHHARIKVQERPEKGTCFGVYFPIYRGV